MFLGVLGPLEIHGPVGLAPIGAPRVRRLLARLAVHPEVFIDRTDLIDALWPDGDLPRRPDKALQDTVSDLRRTLARAAGHTSTSAPEIETRPDGRAYRIALGTNGIDAVIAEGLTASADRALAAGDLRTAVSVADEALALFRGRPYEEFEGDEFAQAEIVRLESLFWDTVECRHVAGAGLGDRRCLLELPEMVERQPLRWRLWGAWITALARAGRQAEALQAFQAARSSLADLGLDAPPALVELDRQVSQDSRNAGENVLFPVPIATTTVGGHRATASGAADRLPRLLNRPNRLPFAGRSTELARLVDAWNRSERGGAQFVLVTGEAGIGKTRLVQELASTAARNGVIFAGACREGMQLPYQPFAEFMRHDHFLADMHDDSPGDRWRAYRAFSGWLGETSGDRAAMLVVEDLQWATASTALLLRQILGSNDIGGLLTICTARHSEIGDAHPTRELLNELAARGDIQTIALGGLDFDALDTLLAATSATTDAHNLLEITGGNPFFVESMLLDIGDTDAGPIPTRLREAVSVRLSRLTREEQRALAVASVVGRVFNIATIERTDELRNNRSQLLDSLEHCVQLELVHEVSGNIGEFAFVHDVVREVVYNTMLAARRADRHFQVSKALQDLGPVDPGILAHHLVRAGALGNTDATVRALLAAGRHALAQSAVEEAISRLVEAQQTLATTGRRLMSSSDDATSSDSTSARLAAELELTLSIAHKLKGQIADSKAAADRATIIAADHSLLDLLADAAVEHAAFGQGWGPDSRSLELCALALSRLPVADPAARARVMARIAYHRAYWDAPGPLPEGLAREALLLAESAADNRAIVAALRALEVALLQRNSMRERIAIGERLVQLGESTAETTTSVNGFRCVALAAFESGEGSLVDRSLAQLSTLATNARLWYAAADAERWRALRALSMGDWTATRNAIQRHRAIVPDNAVYQASSHVQELVLGRELGELPDFPNDYGEAGALIRVGFRCLRALSLSERGDHRGAAALLDEHVPAGVWQHANPLNGLILPALIEASARVGRLDHLERMVGSLDSFGDQLLTSTWGEICLGSAARFRGIALLALGRGEAAVEALQRALAFEGRADAQALAARTGRWLAIASAATGAPRHVVEGHRDVAIERADLLGMRELVRELESDRIQP